MSRVRPGWEGQWIIGPAGYQVLAPFVDIKGSGIRTISSLDSYWRQCWSRLALPMRRRRACPVSRVHTQRSQRSSLTRCSVQAASSSWDQTRLWQPLYRGGCRSIVGWRSHARHNLGRHDGNRFRHGMYSGRHSTPGLCNRTSLQANTPRLHERNCIDRIDQSTAKAVRLYDRKRRTSAEPVGDRRCNHRRKDKLGSPWARARHADGDPSAREQQAAARHSDCRRRGNGRRGRAGSWEDWEDRAKA